MGALFDGWIVVGMFVLRIGVPLAVVLALGYFLKRLDARWEAEARAERARGAEAPAPQPAAPRPVSGPRVDVPGPQLPFDPSRVRPAQPGAALQPGLMPPPHAGQPRAPGLAAGPVQASGLLPGGRRCSDVKGCSDAARAQCPAGTRSDRPCWQLRMEAEGQMPNECRNCEVFETYSRM